MFPFKLLCYWCIISVLAAESETESHFYVISYLADKMKKVFFFFFSFVVIISLI